jgi:gliding motility-associated protein GldM
MASGKLSPRQKMINMMYLVLIALLALNVSKDILKAFHLFELSFINANKNADSKNTDVMNKFQANMDDPLKKAKTEKWYNLAKQAQVISKDFTDYVEKTKTDIIKGAGDRKPPEPGQTTLGELTQPDNMEKHANYFVLQGNGKKLQDKINETRKKLLALMEGTTKDAPAAIKTLENSTQLRAEDPKNEGMEKSTWISTYLEHAPLAGVATFLTKTQNDCKALEADVLNFLANNIDANTAKFTDVAALIVSETNYVMSGSSYRAKVALMAYNSKADNKIVVNGSAVKVENGMGEIVIPASGVGPHTVTAEIESIDPATGEPKMIKTQAEWISFMPSATIAADAMNVLYVGLDNPMSISVPGVTAANTNVSAGAGLTLSKASGDGKYIAKVAAGSKETTITVSAKMPDGTSKSMGQTKFRIKTVPKPVAQLGTLQSGPANRGEIALQNTLYAYLDGFVFDGVKFTVTKYRVIFMPKRGYMEEASVNGNGTAAIKQYAAKAKPGDMLVIEGIRANGPGGEKALQPITYTFK